MEVPTEQLAALDITPRTVLMVENLETGLALPDMVGVVAVMKLSVSVKLVANVQWLVQARCLYWGNIDTYGFEILNRARSVLPHLRSILMDVDTLLNHKTLCVTEHKQVAVESLPLLTKEEREVFEGLRADRWGTQLRLEQERISWGSAVDQLMRTIGGVSLVR